MAKQKTVPYKTVQKLGLKWANHDVSLFALIAITSLRPAARPYSFALTSPKCPQSLQRKVCDDGHPPTISLRADFPLPFSMPRSNAGKYRDFQTALRTPDSGFGRFCPLKADFLSLFSVCLADVRKRRGRFYRLFRARV